MDKMDTRRDFLKSVLGVSTLLIFGNRIPLLAIQNYIITGGDRYKDIIDDISVHANLPINELMLKIALKFIDVPYVSNTLEGDEGEICRINFEGLDCVTFYELVLCMARVFKKGDFSISGLAKEITYVRYRNGIIDEYDSRLHYTSDWIYDNVKKNVVVDITKSLGGIKFEPEVAFMSSHPTKYNALENNQKLVKNIKAIEKIINSRNHYFIPKDQVKFIEKSLNDADIIGIVTSIRGLDYSHTGLISKSNVNVANLFHASTKKNKVIIDVPISEYLKNNKSSLGITVVRPLEIS